MQDCGSVFHQEMCVSGEVTITPSMECGEVAVHCLRAEILKEAPKRRTKRQCSFTVYQHVCVEVPVIVTADSVCRFDQVACQPAQPGPCPEAP